MMELLMEEENKDEDQRRGSSVAGWLAPLQAPELEEGRPVGPRFWHGGQGAQKAGQELPISAKAQEMALAVELARQLQWEEIAVEEVQHGQDAATLAVVREAAGLLIRGQLEGLGGPS